MKLTKRDWQEAAYGALLKGGARAVAVATISQGLGATRGSFYHYFGSRDELLGSALEIWEDRATTAFIESANEDSDPSTRLQRLFSQVFRKPTDLAAVELHLATDRATEPAVEAAVHRVTLKRKRYLAECYQGLGFDDDDAWDRALIAYMMFLGWLNLDEAQQDPSPHHARHLAHQVGSMLLPIEPFSDRDSTKS